MFASCALARSTNSQSVDESEKLIEWWVVLRRFGCSLIEWREAHTSDFSHPRLAIRARPRQRFRLALAAKCALSFGLLCAVGIPRVTGPSWAGKAYRTPTVKNSSKGRLPNIPKRADSQELGATQPTHSFVNLAGTYAYDVTQLRIRLMRRDYELEYHGDVVRS